MATGRRLQIVHRTGFRYAEVVEASFNEVRMTPLTEKGQMLLNHSLDVRPAAAVQSYGDYWGALVEAFDVHVPHRLLEIVATSTVDTAVSAPRTAGTFWSVVLEPLLQDRFAEFLVPTGYVDDPSVDPLRSAIVEEMRRAETPYDAAVMAVAAVRDRITYTPGITDVSTTAAQAWESRHGVCQDFTHTTLALLRASRIPARYVSGYLHTEESAPGPDGHRGVARLGGVLGRRLARGRPDQRPIGGLGPRDRRPRA